MSRQLRLPLRLASFTRSPIRLHYSSQTWQAHMSTEKIDWVLLEKLGNGEPD